MKFTISRNGNHVLIGIEGEWLQIKFTTEQAEELAGSLIDCAHDIEVRPEGHWSSFDPADIYAEGRA